MFPFGRTTTLTAAGLQVMSARVFCVEGLCAPSVSCGHAGPGCANGRPNEPPTAGSLGPPRPEFVTPGSAGDPGTDETFGMLLAPGRSPTCGGFGRLSPAAVAGRARIAATANIPARDLPRQAPPTACGTV